MILATNFPVAAVGLASALLIGPPNEARAAPPSAVATAFELAQAMLPRTGMMDAQHPMPMNERYLKRFPQPARVGDLIGLPVLDLNSSTIGVVREIVRTAAGQIEFIINYSRWWGWFGRPVAVPLEKLGIEGRHLMSLDMSPSDYAAAPTWHNTGAAPLSADATVRVALSRS
jgi:PRC-barrel domain